MLSKIFIGFSLVEKPDLDVESLLPVFKAPSNYKTAEAIDKFVHEAELKWRSGVGQLLYTGEFDQVHIIDPLANSGAAEAHFERGKWCDHPIFAHRAKTEPGEPLSVALQVRQFLVGRHLSAWTDDIFAPRPNGPDAIFLGFRIKAFLKVLGIECALAGNPLPLSMWYGNDAHRDIEKAIVPEEFAGKGVALSTALAYFEDAGSFYNSVTDKNTIEVPDDYAPGRDVKLDATLSLLLGTRLGLVTERDSEAVLDLRMVPKAKTKKKRARPSAEAVAT